MWNVNRELNTFKIGARQKLPIESYHRMEEFTNTVKATTSYMSETVMVDTEYETVRRLCVNADWDCTIRAMNGDCERPENYDDLEDDDERIETYESMMMKCSPTCQTCHKLLLTEEDREVIDECTPDLETNAFEDGDDLENMFLRIVKELPYDEGVIVPNYTVTILSRPSPDDEIEEEEEEVNEDTTATNEGHEAEDEDNLPLVGGPWVVVLDNFLTDEECDRLIELGGIEGYKRSELEDKTEGDAGVDDTTRTSTNAWCMDECYADPIAERVIAKIANTTGIPDENSEYLQLLRYSKFSKMDGWLTLLPTLLLAGLINIAFALIFDI